MKIIVTVPVLLSLLLASCNNAPETEANAAATIARISQSNFGLSSEALAYLISGPGFFALNAEAGKIHMSQPPVDELIAAGYLELHRKTDATDVIIVRSKRGEQVHRLFVSREPKGFVDSLESPEP